MQTRLRWPLSLSMILTACLFMVSACAPSYSASPPNQDIIISSIYWSDGDSGRINGSIKFRLNDIDAPETGGVGAAVGGANCEAERAKGYGSKAWGVSFTKDTALKITQTHGQDRHERLIIDLSSNEQDVGKSGLKAGYYKAWPHKGKKALSERPKWCLE